MTAETRWQAAVAKVLKGAPLDSLVTRTRDGIAVPPLSPPAGDIAPILWRDTGRPFRIVQRVDHSDPAEARALARADVEGGASGLALVMAGCRSARGFGMAPEDVAEVLADLPADRLAWRLEGGPAEAAPVVHALLRHADRQGFAPEALDIDVGIDPLGAMAETGEPQDEAAGLALTKTLRDAGFSGSVWRADGRPYHEAGASEAQELAAVLATGVASLRRLESLGLDAAASTISFGLVVDQEILTTIAKLRALRRLWASVEAACGLAPRPIRLHAETAWRTMTQADPHTNLLRSVVASAGALLGGADSLAVLPFTSALGLPDAAARRLARNTPLILIEEAHLMRVADVLGGAGSVEALTEALCGEAWTLFQSLEQGGGLAAALRAGSWQARIAATRAARARDIAEGRASLVGVTAFAAEGSLAAPPVLRPGVAAGSRGETTFPALPSIRDAAAAEAVLPSMEPSP